jgi:hypothetical protein
MADTSLQAMLRNTGVAGMSTGGFATLINSGTSTCNTAVCNSTSTHILSTTTLMAIAAPL